MTKRAGTDRPQRAKLSPTEMRGGVRRFQKLIHELANFDPSKIDDRDDPEVTEIENAIRTAVEKTYEAGTTQYHQYIDASSIDRASYNMYGTSIGEVREGLEKGKAQATVLIKGAIDDLKEDLEDVDDALSKETEPEHARPSVLYDVHPEIVKKCTVLCDAGAFAEAVECSFKVVRDRLRSLTGHETGSEAFGKGRLHINGAAASNVEEDFNQAVKFLTMAIDMFRNEKSHTSCATIKDPVRAHHYLILSSLAMLLLDNAEVRK